MKKKFVTLSLLAFAILSLGLSGCNEKPNNYTPIEKTSDSQSTDDIEDGDSLNNKDSKLSFELVSGRAEYSVIGLGASQERDVIVPDTYHGLPVTKIESNAFSSTDITSITLPDTISSIGDCAFQYCYSLTKMNIPKKITNIGKSAFDNCISLKELYFNATFMTDITFLHKADETGYIFKNIGQASDGVVVTIGANATKIPANLFYTYNSNDAPNIVSVEFEQNSLCKSIGEYAFTNCKNLKCVSICNAITNIGKNAFMNCDNLIDIYISDITAWCNIEFGNSFANPLYSAQNLHLNNERVTELIIPNNVTHIKDMAFAGCDSFESIVIPDSVTSIGEKIFYGCNSLECISIPFVGKNPSAIEHESMFGYLFGYTITKSSSNIDGAVFQYCDPLDCYPNQKYYHYYIPSSLKSVNITNGSCIGRKAFQNCTSLINVNMSNSITSIGYCAFSGCESLTNITIPDSVKSIDTLAFSECESLISITIPNSVESIGSSAFSNCFKLTDITIGNNVNSIGDFVFSNCFKLKNIVFKDISTWYYTKDTTYWEYKIGGVEVSVVSPSSTAEFFRQNPTCYWYKL